MLIQVISIQHYVFTIKLFTAINTAENLSFRKIHEAQNSLKFIYSGKATTFCEISIVDLSYVVPVKSTVEISQNFVAFSEYMNFNRKISLQNETEVGLHSFECPPKNSNPDRYLYCRVLCSKYNCHFYFYRFFYICVNATQGV